MIVFFNYVENISIQDNFFYLFVYKKYNINFQSMRSLGSCIYVKIVNICFVVNYDNFLKSKNLFSRVLFSKFTIWRKY